MIGQLLLRVKEKTLLAWPFLSQRRLREIIRGGGCVCNCHPPSGQNKWNEFSIVAGYNYQPNSNPDVTIGDIKFQLFTSGSRAWSFSPSEDEKIVKYLKNSMKMKVVGTSSRGTITNDTYSLVGFSKAYQKINEACKKKK